MERSGANGYMHAKSWRDHAALKKAKIPDPYVLVGHSLGALVARLYASDYPDEVLGMVIVDHVSSSIKVLANAPALLPLGIDAGHVDQQEEPTWPTSAVKTYPNFDFQKLSPNDYQLHLWGGSLPGHAKIMERNVAMTPGCFSEVAQASQQVTVPLGDKPLIILSTPAIRVFADTLASLSSDSKAVLVDNSSHYIMIDRPEVVINAIREVVEAANNHSRLSK